ncbi:MAG: hypothetical protein KME49_25730 [Brasilonema octagenarum HA4186-MV1]|nr:hypothetical protein [Brasilonema octagenarum HA4186-MV1]
MITTKYDRLLVGILAAINELSLIKQNDDCDMISVIKTLVKTLASAARQAEDRDMVIIDCVEQSIVDLLNCIVADEEPTAAMACVKSELSTALILSGRWKEFLE